MKKVKNIGEQKKTKKLVSVLIVLVCCIVLGISALAYINRKPVKTSEKQTTNTGEHSKPEKTANQVEETKQPKDDGQIVEIKSSCVPEFPDDPFMSCIYEYAEEMGVDEYSDYVIPAPSVYWVDYENPEDIKVYCNLWSYGYTKKGNILFSESGGECPGRLHIRKSDTGGYEVMSFDRVGDGSYYAKDIKRICQDSFQPKWLENMYYQDKSEGTYRKHSRMVILARYIRVHPELNDVEYYQDYGWDPVKIEPIRKVYVDNALYEDTGRFDLETCGTGMQKLDKVTKNGEDPTENGQTNFQKTQYLWKSDDELAVKVHNEFYVFRKVK